MPFSSDFSWERLDQSVSFFVNTSHLDPLFDDLDYHGEQASHYDRLLNLWIGWKTFQQCRLQSLAPLRHQPPSLAILELQTLLEQQWAHVLELRWILTHLQQWQSEAPAEHITPLQTLYRELKAWSHDLSVECSSLMDLLPLSSHSGSSSLLT